MNCGGLMKSYKGEQGSITIVALLVLVVLTILGITLTRTTTLDLRIGTNSAAQTEFLCGRRWGLSRSGRSG